MPAVLSRLEQQFDLGLHAPTTSAVVGGVSAPVHPSVDFRASIAPTRQAPVRLHTPLYWQHGAGSRPAVLVTTVADGPTAVFEQLMAQLEEADRRTADDPLTVNRPGETAAQYFNRVKVLNIEAKLKQAAASRPTARQDAEAMASTVTRLPCGLGALVSGPGTQRWQPVLSTGLLFGVTSLFLFFEGNHLPGPRFDLGTFGLVDGWTNDTLDMDDNTVLGLHTPAGPGWPLLAFCEVGVALLSAAALWRVSLTDPGYWLPLPRPTARTMPKAPAPGKFAGHEQVATRNGTAFELEYCWVRLLIALPHGTSAQPQAVSRGVAAGLPFLPAARD